MFDQVATSLGAAGGVALAAPFAALSAMRKARVFHPRGVMVAADVIPAGDLSAEVSGRLAGPAIVRLSAALHASPDSSVDLLGCAVRLLPPWDAASTSDAVQDLLLVTGRSLAQLPLALLTTRTGDFLANSYYSIAPFEIEGLGIHYLRVRGNRRRSRVAHGDAGARLERLEEALDHERASLYLEVRRPGLGRRYRPLADIHLRHLIDLDQQALAFSPFRCGRGIRPRGFINELRQAVYPASARARQLRTRGPAALWRSAAETPEQRRAQR